jgi:hypothetical protein
MSVELKLKPRQLHPVHGHQKSKGGMSGATKVRRPQSKDELAAAQAATRRSQPTLHLERGRKRRWIRPNPQPRP